MNPFQAAPNQKKLMTVIGTYVAMITSIFISSSSSLLLPAAAKEIGGLEFYPLATTLVSCLSIALMPMFGFIAAKNPAAKRPLAAASFLVAGLIILSRGFAQSMWFIIIPSIFLGVYSPAIYVLGYSTIRDMYDVKKAGVFLGLAGTMQSIGSLAGAPLVGLLTDLAGWRIPFFVIGPLFILAALLVYFGVKVTKDQVKHMVSASATFDLPGALGIVVFLASTILALSLGRLAPFGSMLNNILWVIAAAALVTLIAIIARKQEKAIIPAPVLRDVNTLSLTAYNFLANFSTMALYFFMPLYATRVMLQSSAAAGLTLTCFAVAGLFLGPIFGQMIGKAGNARFVALLTTAVRIAVLVAFILFLRPTTSIFFVYALMLVGGIFSSGGGVVPAVGPQIQIAPEKRQMGNSVVQLGSGFGASIGIAIYTMVIGMAGVEQGMATSLIIATAAAVLLFFTSLPLRKLEPASSAAAGGTAPAAPLGKA